MKKLACFLLLLLLTIILSGYLNDRFFKDSFLIESVIAKTNNLEEENFNIMKSMIKKATIKSNNLFSLFKEKEVLENKCEEKVVFEETPVFYIYNTHQTENYVTEKIGNNVLEPTVLTAANLLKDELEKLGIGVVVEERSIKKRLDEENWPYDHSYRISREYMEDKKQKTPTLEVFIDLHRDSIAKDAATVKINGKSYAKVMFLVGKENKTYKENEIHINKMEDWLKDNYPSLLRNRYYRDYVYNQDFTDTTFLLELGSNNNTLEEVTNTIEVVSKMFYEWYKKL